MARSPASAVSVLVRSVVLVCSWPTCSIVSTVEDATWLSSLISQNKVDDSTNVFQIPPPPYIKNAVTELEHLLVNLHLKLNGQLWALNITGTANKYYRHALLCSEAQDNCLKFCYKIISVTAPQNLVMQFITA